MFPIQKSTIMFSRIVNKIASFLLVVIVLISTSGFTVFKHSCLSENTTEYSIIIPDFNCDHSEHDDHASLPSCCLIHDPVKDESCGESNCCDTEVHMVKLHINIDVQDQKNVHGTDYFRMIVETTADNLIPCSKFKHIIISNDLPPPLSGKALHIFLNQLNIPNYSV